MSYDRATPADARDTLSRLGRGWWVLALIGALSVIAGVIVIVKPSHSLATLAVVAGIFILLDSIYELARAALDRVENRSLSAVMAAVGLVVGILLIRHPVHGVVAVAIVVGIWLVAAGAIRLVLAFNLPARGWHMAVAIIQIIFGVIIVSSPDIGYSALALIIGLAFIVNGLTLVAVGAVVRSLTSLRRPAAPAAGARS